MWSTDDGNSLFYALSLLIQRTISPAHRMGEVAAMMAAHVCQLSGVEKGKGSGDLFAGSAEGSEGRDRIIKKRNRRQSETDCRLLLSVFY